VQACGADGLEFVGQPRNYDASTNREAPLSETEPIIFLPRSEAPAGGCGAKQKSPNSISSHSASAIFFSRRELSDILAVYGRKVASGEWRDYAIDVGRDRAVFSVFRRASEFPLYRIEKNARLMRKQAGYSIVGATGLILKRGSDLRRVLGVLERPVRLVEH
jgi:hypothetical protein